MNGSITAKGTGPLPSTHDSHPIDLLMAVVVVVLLVAYLPGLEHTATTPRAVVLWSVGGWGLVSLVWLAVRDVPARWALGFLGWALVSAATSGGFRRSLFSA